MVCPSFYLHYFDLTNVILQEFDLNADEKKVISLTLCALLCNQMVDWHGVLNKGLFFCGLVTP